MSETKDNCRCCDEPFKGVEPPRLDADLGPVCTPCLWHLRQAQAELKHAGIKPCTTEHDGRGQEPVAC